MESIERNKLINELNARGFEELVENENFGWVFEHGNGFIVRLGVSGYFRFQGPNSPEVYGTAKEAQTVLDLVDQAMSEF